MRTGGIVHRDIKTGNVISVERAGDHTLTRTGQIVACLYYMPPEQLRTTQSMPRRTSASNGVVPRRSGGMPIIAPSDKLLRHATALSAVGSSRSAGHQYMLGRSAAGPGRRRR